MNDLDMKLDKLTRDFIKHSLEASEDTYQEIKATLLIKGSDSPRAREYLRLVFDYIDKHRPKLIGMTSLLTTPSSEL